MIIPNVCVVQQYPSKYDKTPSQYRATDKMSWVLLQGVRLKKSLNLNIELMGRRAHYTASPIIASWSVKDCNQLGIVLCRWLYSKGINQPTSSRRNRVLQYSLYSLFKLLHITYIINKGTLRILYYAHLMYRYSKSVIESISTLASQVTYLSLLNWWFEW